MNGLPFEATYPVIPGRQYGRTTGFPTLNLDLEGYHPPLDTGIYAGWTIIGRERYPSAIHYGPRPMLGDTALSLETYLLDTILVTTPPVVSIQLAAYLRAIAEFPDEASLIRQMKQDVERTREALMVSSLRAKRSNLARPDRHGRKRPRDDNKEAR